MDVISKLAALILKPYVKGLSRKALPEIQGIVNSGALKQKSSCIRDKWGVAHIYAQEITDLFFVQGFTHAQDRIFQMEIMRRIAKGRLSEIFGEETLSTDRFSRSLSFGLLANDDENKLSNEMKEVLSAYTEGVNFFIQHHKDKLPVEFKLLKIKPEQWTAHDSLSIARMASWQMGFVWYGKLFRSTLESKLGEKADLLDLSYLKQNPDTVKYDFEFNVFETSRALKNATGPWLRNITGSNAWTVSGQKTDSGYPYLCNDMHLASLQPSIWYENHLECPGYRVTGVSMPGVPMVMVGHNQHIAWGMTLAFTEIQDLYFIDNKTFEQKTFEDKDGKTQFIDVREEIFEVKGKKKPLKEKFYRTTFGPVLHTLTEKSGLKFLMHSPALGENQVLQGWYKLNHAKQWDDFVDAVQLIDAPALNIAYADVFGNTGYYLSGKTPRRNAPEGRFLIPASYATEKVANLTMEEKPHAFNPEKGFLVSSNHRIVSDDYPHFLGDSWMDGYRAKRLKSLLAKKDRFSANDMQQMQSDWHCLAGIELKKCIEDCIGDVEVKTKAFLLFKDWDGNADPDSVGMAVYSVWKNVFLDQTVKELTGEDYLTLRGKGPDEVLTPLTEFYGQEATVITRILTNPNVFFEQGNTGLRNALIQSFVQTETELKRLFGKSAQDWKWGKRHTLSFVHAFGKKAPFDQVFNQGPFPYGGDVDTPCQAAWHPDRPFDGSLIIPSARFVFDTSDWERSISVIPPGQSERIGSEFYQNQLDLFLDFHYKPMLWEKDSVFANQLYRLDFDRK